MEDGAEVQNRRPESNERNIIADERCLDGLRTGRYIRVLSLRMNWSPIFAIPKF